MLIMSTLIKSWSDSENMGGKGNQSQHRRTFSDAAIDLTKIRVRIEPLMQPHRDRSALPGA